MADHQAFARFIDRWTIEYVRTYPHPIERVWRAISEAVEVSAWFWTARFEPRAGAPYVFGEDDSDFRGVIAAVEPPHRLRFGGPKPHGPSGYFEFNLEPVERGTRLTFVQHSEPGFFRNSDWPIDPPDLEEGPGLPWRPGTLSGWHSALDCLGDYLGALRLEAQRAAEERAMRPVYRQHLRSLPTA